MKLLLISAFGLVSSGAFASAPADLAFERLAYEIQGAESEAQKLDSSTFYINSLDRIGARPASLLDCVSFALSGLADKRSCSAVSARIIGDGGGGTGGVD